jgi:hypothetical protein
MKENKTWLIKRNAEINNNKFNNKNKGTQWYTQTAVYKTINSKSKPSGSKSQKNDDVYIYQTDIGIWAKGKIKSGSEDNNNFHYFDNARDVITFSKTKAKYKNDAFWGNIIINKLHDKQDGKFTFVVFEAKLEIEVLENEITVHENKIPGGQVSWSELREGLEEVKTKNHELSKIIPPSLRHKLLIKFNSYFNAGTALDIDHHVPQAIGGPGNIEENLVPLSAAANRYKGAKIPEGLFEVAEEYQNHFNIKDFQLLKKKVRDKYRIEKDYPFLEYKIAKHEAEKIITIVNQNFSFDEARNFYKKVRAKIYKSID